MEADTTVAFERLVDRHRNMQEMEQYGSCAGRGLVYCGIMVVMDLWTQGPDSVLSVVCARDHPSQTCSAKLY